MRVSVVIPSLNSPIIDQVLDQIWNQDASDQIHEVVVVGKDDPGLIAPSLPAKFIDTGSRVTASQARNRGIASTDADLYVFLDSDCLPVKDWLSQHLTAHASGHSVVGGGVLPTGDNYWALVYNLTLFHEFLTTNKPAARDYLPGLNMSIDRSVIDTVGIMDETIHRVEDIEWTTRMRRAGFQPFLWPAAAVEHRHNRTGLDQVWHDCASSGSRMRLIRLRYREWLQAPRILAYPRLVLLLSPLIAAWTTARIVARQPKVFARFWYTLPAIYLTKIAWCWGASRGEGNYALS